MQWLPIESAPKDGTEILLFEPRGAVARRYSLNASSGTMFAGRFKTLYQSWSSTPGDYQRKPTHWMPLPDPPADWKPSTFIVPPGIGEEEK